MSGGSSPRGRGTRGSAPASASSRRFIPARAGNTHRRIALRCRRSVHPRAGGEHGDGRGPNVSRSGSSPRGRGTRVYPRCRYGLRRFIPARAGNTPAGTPKPRGRPVHPRAGGEHGVMVPSSRVRIGSSPRGRGTPSSPRPSHHRRRFIPARAGNTGSSRTANGPRSVHPRAGGEHTPRICRERGSPGSSPRGRGTRAALAPEFSLWRFIPRARAARAGNTSPRGRSPHGSSPRGRPINFFGERFMRDGSSPRGRGTPFPQSNDL